MTSNQKNPEGTLRLFRYYKLLTERTIRQLKDDDLYQTPSNGLNSITVLMKHLSGNMISRWTNYRTEDGEKPWRERESEFINDLKSRSELTDYWEKGWETLFQALESVNPGELDHIIYIRNEGHTIKEAIERHLAHVAYHTGQIVLLAKWKLGDEWEALTIPKEKTDEFNQKKFNEPKSRGFYKNRMK